MDSAKKKKGENIILHIRQGNMGNRGFVVEYTLIT
jgi:hypothetical protein